MPHPQLPTEPLAIGALARLTGTNVETVRYYERIGTLPVPGQSPGGQRRYVSAHLKRLNFVRRSRGLGFSPADEDGGSCDQVRQVADNHLDEIGRKIADLIAMEDVFRTMVGCCSATTVPDYPILEALFEQGA